MRKKDDIFDRLSNDSMIRLERHKKSAASMDLLDTSMVESRFCNSKMENNSLIRAS
jgi:hypothetical protein